MGPLNLGETLDASIKIVRSQWRTLALVILVVAGPLQILDLLITTATTDTYTLNAGFANDTRVTYDDEAAYVGGQAVIFVLTALSYLLGTVACFRAVAAVYLDRPTSPGASLRFAVGRLGPTLWLTVVFSVGIALAVVALI